MIGSGLWQRIKVAPETFHDKKLCKITYLKTNLMISSSKQSFEEESFSSIIDHGILKWKLIWNLSCIYWYYLAF